MQKYKPDSKIKRHFDSVFSKEDPWSYESEYEMQKRRHLLNMLLSERSLKALEIGCAEGHVTSELASRVRHLVAVIFRASGRDI
jgi:ubiquinone/menaquinone biosynthesis C-methylase UbiE